MILGTKIKIDDLTLLRSLGKGSYGEVFLTSKEGKSELFATKKMDRKYADQPHVAKYLKNEISIMRELKHKNIVKLEDMKITPNHYYLVMDFCNGGTLSECLRKYQKKNKKPFSVEIVQYLMRQIIDGIRYIHNKNIIHRDLKLDNILVHFNSEIDRVDLNMMKAVVKIIDFGLSTHIEKSNLCYSTLGSPINMDPNILIKMNENKLGINIGKKVGYDQKADIWSLGTLCYEMLIGKPAFNSKSLQELVQKVESGSYSIPTSLSKEVVSFLNGMLQYNAKKRLSANELARHHFLTKNVRDFEPIDVRKVSNKINQNNLKVNIKRNKTIWSIFNEDDEKKLINIPGNYLSTFSPIREEDELNHFNENSNKRRNTEEKPRLTNNFKKKYPHDSISPKSRNKNNLNFKSFLTENKSKNLFKNNKKQISPNYPKKLKSIDPKFRSSMPMLIPEPIPIIEKIEPENDPMMMTGPRPIPTIELPSFGVPSPGEDLNPGIGDGFNNGIFQPYLPPFPRDNGRNIGGYGYGHGYGYGYGPY